MGMVEVARDALKDIPISEVLRERVSLALDRLAEAERQISLLQTEKGGLQAQLDRERVDHEQTKKELQALKESLHEEVRVIRDVEFRRGSRTGGEWMPFCPKCHLPLGTPRDPTDYYHCGDHKCEWYSATPPEVIRRESIELD